MNNNIYYICQTLVEDGRMDQSTFKKRVIYPLNEILKSVSNLSLCMHPRSNKSIYSDLLINKKIKIDKFSYDYVNESNIFLGHYSTIIFNLITSSEKVILIDIDWDHIPDYISQSSSLSLHWGYFNKINNRLDMDSIEPSKPNDQLLSMFEDPISNEYERKKFFDLIF